jgi:hypothetical protein
LATSRENRQANAGTAPDTKVASSAGLGNVPIAWTIVATGDFNDDRHGDLLWQDTSGNPAL